MLAINGESVTGRKLGERDVIDDILSNEDNFPISLKWLKVVFISIINSKIDLHLYNFRFGLLKLTTNEKIVLSSMFHSLYAIAALQIGSKKDKLKSSGIEMMETDNFRLNCLQTMTGVKFLVISDLTVPANKDVLLKKIYELYTDYALKNPFYSLDMPIR